MSQLLANYDAARKAIFDHCGVPDGTELELVEVVHDPWSMGPRNKSVLVNGQRKRWYWVCDSAEPRVSRGASVTLIRTMRGAFEDAAAWLALDNAMEVKP